MFAIEKNGSTVGRVLIGSSAYGFPVLEAGKAPPFSIPPAGEVSSILKKKHGLQIHEVRLGEPMLLLVNILRGFYAVWELEGQVVGINLITGRSFTAANLPALDFAMPCPVEYKLQRAVTRQSLVVSPYWEPLWDWGAVLIRHAHLMRSWRELAWPLHERYPSPPYPDHYGKLWCGPASGVSIAAWKRDADGDAGLHPPRQELHMFRSLRGYMYTLSPPVGWTFPWHYGPGFVNYGTSRAEHFTWSYRSTLSHIKSDIANDWPLGLCGWMDIGGEKKAHWVAVKGWGWCLVSQYVIVTDSYTDEDNRWLCWDALNAGLFLFLIRIQDTDN